MGLKYIETVKSIVLTILILLSVTLTFLIWTYTPRYETVDQLPTVDISIADKKKVDEIIKPYKVIFHYEEQLTGSFLTEDLSYISKEMKKWSIDEVELVDSDFEDEELVAFMRQPNTLTLYYQGEVPLPVYEAIIEIDNQNTSEASFDRLIIDWGTNENMSVIYFVSRVNGLLYRGVLHPTDRQQFQQAIVEWGKELMPYTEVDPNQPHFLAVPANRIETIQSSYYEEEISPNRFRDALFADPNAVRRSQVSAVHEEFGDDHALMSVDTESKMLSYVLPAAESKELAIPSELLLNTIDFVNEHGGWTDEFRFAYMNPITRYVKFQLYVNGLPVFSDAPGATEIAQIWGENRNFRYIRPYYSLNVPLPETEAISLQSGPEAAKMLMDSFKVEINAVEELVPGYQLKYEKEQKLMTLEPTWFYLIKGKWMRVSPELLGGDSIGLE